MEQLQKQLEDMGFEPAVATAALNATGSRNVESAVLWLCGPDAADAAEGARSPLEDTPVVGVPTVGEAVGAPSSSLASIVQPGGERSAAFVRGVNGEFKAVLVVRGELGMSAGKVGAQCAHAAVGLYKRCLATGVPWLLAWEAQGEKTVVLRAQSEREMETLERQAERLGLPTYQVYDAGRTEVAAGSATVLGVGGPADLVDQVTGQLRTL